MTPNVNAWLFGRVPVILFGLTALIWIVYIAYAVANRPTHPSYPDIGVILAIASGTLAGGLLSFLLSAYGLRCSSVPKRWAWTGLILNAPIVLYIIGYYPVVFIYRSLAAP